MIAQQLAALLSRPAVPATTAVNGQRHMLAYITPQEAELLAARGGGSMAAPGMQLAHGLRAFSDGDGDGSGGGNDGNTSDGPSGPGQGDDAGFGGWGDSAGFGGWGDGPSGPGQGDDAGYGGWGDESGNFGDAGGPGQQNDEGWGGWGGESGGFGDAGGPGQQNDEGWGGWGGGSGDEGGNIGSEGGNTSGASDDSNYGTTVGPPAPPPPPPPRDLAGEAEARVRARYGSSVGNVWLDALKGRFTEEAQGILEQSYRTARADARDRLRTSGYEATPLASYQLSGIDAQRDPLLKGIGPKWDSRAKDYEGRVASSLAQAIAAARAGLDPDAAEGIADQYITALNADIATNPGAAFEAKFIAPGAAAAPVQNQQQAAADALRRALLLASTTGASRVGA